MSKPSPENRPDIQIENSKEIDPNNFSFRQLKEAYELAPTTFTQIEDGFISASGDEIIIGKPGNNFKLKRFPGTNRQDLHREILSESHDSILRTGSPNKEEMINAIKNLLEKTGNRIIE